MHTVWLIGRTNVGKSTLFNRLLGTYRAIVTDISGTTRELLREEVDLLGRHVELVDSPWLAEFEDELQFIEQIIDESDVLCFVVDGKEWITEFDRRIFDLIMKKWVKEKTMLVVNKLDKKVYREDVEMFYADWYTLWFVTTLPLSAQQNEGIEDLVERIVISLPITADELDGETKPRELDENTLPLAIVGKPNSGKSTLMNTLVGEYVSHVQDTPGTTLDYLVSTIQRKWKEVKLYDTAWIRKKWKTVWLERIAYQKTLSMLKFVHPVVALIFDLNEWLTQRDKTIFAEIIELGLPVVLVVNKIDLFEKEQADLRLQQILKRNTFLSRVPVVKISWKEAIGVPSLLDAVEKVRKQWNYRIGTSDLNKVMTRARLTRPPRFPKNKICKWKYITQVEVWPPTFLLSVNNKQYANFSFRKWCENVIRQAYWFEGIPIVLKFTSKVNTNPYLEKNK